MSAGSRNEAALIPAALAKCFHACKPGDPLLDVLNQLYAKLLPRDKLRCRAALFALREKRRIQIMSCRQNENATGLQQRSISS